MGGGTFAEELAGRDCFFLSELALLAVREMECVMNSFGASGQCAAQPWAATGGLVQTVGRRAEQTRAVCKDSR